MPVRRIFVAIEIPEDVRARVEAYVGELSRRFAGSPVRWVQPVNYHITLLFAGKVDDSALAELSEQVEQTSLEFEPFDLRIAGNGAFVRPDNGVLWIGIEPEAAIKSLQWLAGSLDSKARSKAVPHLTIGRFKHPKRVRELINEHKQTKLDAGGFTADHLTVFESTLLPSGPVYTALSTHNLGA